MYRKVFTRLTQWNILGIIWLTSICYAVSAQTWCNNREGFVRHETKDGSQACCKLIFCNPGTYAVLCNATSDVICVPCPEDGYMPDKHRSDYSVYQQCHTKAKCHKSEGEIVKSEGSRDKNRECECDLERGYYNINHDVPWDKPVCTPKLCHAGKELKRNARCVKCHIGYFKPHRSRFQCHRWTDCEGIGLTLVRYGTTTNDTVCANITAETTTNLPNIGMVQDDNENDGGPPFDIIFGILGGVALLVAIFAFLLCVVSKHRYINDKDSEKQNIKYKDDISSTASSLPPNSKSMPSLAPLDIQKAKKKKVPTATLR